MENYPQSKFHKYEIIGALVLLLVAVISFFPNPGITGFVSVDTKTQKVNLTIMNSQSYILSTNMQQPFYLTSLKISGQVIGKGKANVFLENGKGQKVLVYSNQVKKEKGLSVITGMDKITGKVIGSNSESEGDYLVIDFLENNENLPGGIQKDEELVFGEFNERCEESCFIEMLLNQGVSYQFLFNIEEGTILYIDKIIYSMRKD